MDFAFDYGKHKSKPQNDGFFFDVETPRGHFFAVLDFAPHDYANLNPSLQGKLETIVSSFVSVSSFSADLFLGFLAKEINNFVHNLAEQSGGPELSCSAALCLVSGDLLSYFLRGNTKISLLNLGHLQPLHGDTFGEGERKNRVPAQLGAENLEAPLSDQVQALTLQHDDVVLVMTRGVAEAIESPEVRAGLLNLREPDSQLLCDSLMKASAASREDRTLVVISGPYQRQVGHAASAELSQFEQQFGEQVAALKEYLRSKAATIDLLELDEKVRNLSATLAGKAETAAVLELQRDFLKLGLASSAGIPAVTSETVAETEPSTHPAGDQTPFSLTAIMIILVISLAAGFAGGWLGSRRNRTIPEVWSVKTSGNQITIGRKDDGSNGGNVTLTVAQPLKSTGEQTFSRFADVKQYVDTIMKEQPPPNGGNQAAQADQPTQPKEEPTPILVTEIPFKSGDTLTKLAKRYHTTPRKLIELNPNITRWSLTPVGQKIVVPSPTAAN